MSTDRLLWLFLKRRVVTLASVALMGAAACSGEEPVSPVANDDDDVRADQDEDEDVAEDEDDDAVKAPMPDAKVAPVQPKDAGGKTSLDAGLPPIVVAPSDASTTGDTGTLPDSTIKPVDPVVDPNSPLPRNDEVSVAAKGPYKFLTYTEGLKDPAYESSVMYYPEGATPPYAAIAFSPGFTATKESYTFLGEMLASHGFAVLLTTPTSTSDQPPARGKDLEAAVKAIQAENTRSGSPLAGKIATDRICITGHSMGGGGTLHGATALGDKIRCAVPLQPWQPGMSFDKVTAPTLFIASQSDTIAGVSSNAATHFKSIPSTVEKIYAEFKGADHYLSTNRGVKYDDQASFMVAFYKLKLEDDKRYEPYLYGDKVLMSALSKYEKSK